MLLDRTHRRILDALQRRGRLTNVELAQHVGLSESPCLRRVRALEEGGVITGYGARLDQRGLGLHVTAFVQVSLSSHNEAGHRAFVEGVRALDHVVECHAMSGGYDFLLKVVARNMDHFSQLSMEGILRLPGVSAIESQFSLQTVKAGQELPLTPPQET